MNELKFNFGGGRPIDEADREDVREVWNQADLRASDPYRPQRYQRYDFQPEQIGPENMREYGEDRTEENLRMLEVTGNERMAELYKNLLEENPQLCVVKLVNEEFDGNAAFNWIAKDKVTGQVIPVLRFDFSHPETYRLKTTEAWMPRRDDKKAGIRFTMKRLALKMGADWRRCARNTRLASEAAFLHEMGHAHDFIDNFLTPEYMEREGMSPGARMAESVGAAAQKVTERRRQGVLSMGVRASKVEGEMAYRDMPDEKYADDFSYDYLLDHHDDYFEEESDAPREKPTREWLREKLGGKGASEEKVRVAFGREIPMDADFAYIMGLTEGSGIRVEPVLKPEKEETPFDLKDGDYGLYGYEEAKRYDEDGNYIPKHGRPANYLGMHGKRAEEGIIMTTLREGGPVYLREGENPVSVCGNASWFRYVPSRDAETGRVTTQVYFNDESGMLYKVNRTSD